jgi:glycerophosphoryl diester phosphodiesterase
VHVWTINEPAEMHRLLDLEVDGLVTDHPERMAAVLAERG